MTRPPFDAAALPFHHHLFTSLLLKKLSRLRTRTKVKTNPIIVPHISYDVYMPTKHGPYIFKSDLRVFELCVLLPLGSFAFP